MSKTIIIIIVPETAILTLCGLPSSKVNKFPKLLMIVSLGVLDIMSGLSIISVSELKTLSILSVQSWDIVWAKILLDLLLF